MAESIQAISSKIITNSIPNGNDAIKQRIGRPQLLSVACFHLSFITPLIGSYHVLHRLFSSISISVAYRETPQKRIASTRRYTIANSKYILHDSGLGLN